MAKKPATLERLRAVQQELTEIYLETQTPLLPTPLTQHLADAIYHTMLAAVESLYPDSPVDRKPRQKKLPSPPEIKVPPELPNRNGSPPPIAAHR